MSATYISNRPIIQPQLLHFVLSQPLEMTLENLEMANISMQNTSRHAIPNALDDEGQLSMQDRITKVKL